MSLVNKYNSSKVSFDFNIPSEHKFTSLKNLYNNNGKQATYAVRLFFKNTKGRYGDNYVVATDNELINMPAHLNDTFEQMTQDHELIDGINAGVVGFSIYEYVNKTYNQTAYSINWIDFN